jgi:outer membrane protein assembly factor BamB
MGRGGPGRFGGPPQLGQPLSPFLQDRLSLTPEQKKQAGDLQQDLADKIKKILTAEQQKKLDEPPPRAEGSPAGGRGRSRGGFPQPGQIVPSALRSRLELTAEQKKQLDALQKESDAKLDKLFTADQKEQFQAIREMGRGGFGRGGGRDRRMGGRGRGGGGGRGRAPDVIYKWQVYCLDCKTGKVLWKELALEGKPRIPIQRSNTYATETPVTDGKRVYAYFGMHGVYCYDFGGTLVWKKDLGAYPTQMGQGPASSPVLDGDRLFLQIDNEEDSFLVALNTKNGDELWRVSRNERTNHCSPVVWKNRQRTELVASGSHRVRSYDPATGKLLWELGMGGGRCYSSPVGNADMLYVGCEAGFGMGGGRSRGGDDEDRETRRGGGGTGGGGGGIFAVRAGAAGDISLKEGQTSNAGVAWSQPRGGPEKASPLVYNGHLYILRTNGGIFTCYDAKSGKQLYRQRIPGAAAFWTSPWAADGKIFCLDDAGTTYVLDGGPEFKLIGTNKLNEMFWASPAVAGRSVYLRSVDHLYCVRAKDAK